MSFTEMRSKMQDFSGAKTADYQRQYMATEVNDFLSSLENQFVEYLLCNISDSGKDVDIKTWLGKKYYNPSNEYAKECLEICPDVRHIYGKRIKGWADHALKCFDNFLLKFIQEDLKENIKSDINFLKERDVYKHLILKGDDYEKIGRAFEYIYQTRNEFQHIQIIDQDGHRIPRTLSNRKANEKRDLIIGWFKSALLLLMKKI